MIEVAPLTLTDADRHNELWRRLKAELERWLADCRLKNDNPKLGAEETAALRGEIRTLRRIIALGDETPATTTPPARRAK